MAGLPMKPATNRLTGLVVEFLRLGHLLEPAGAHHRTRVPIVMASTWSCVT